MLYEVITSDLEKLGYISHYYQLNAADFGLPQNRPRLLMISVYVGKKERRKRRVEKYFEKVSPESIVADYRNSEFYQQKKIDELFRTDYSNEKLLSEAQECCPNDTVSRQKIWIENPQLVLHENIVNPAYKMIRTITTKQDRNPNSGNRITSYNVCYTKLLR